MFSAATFANALAYLAGTKNVVDGRTVRVLLGRRPDIEILQGSHYRLVRGV